MRRVPVTAALLAAAVCAYGAACPSGVPLLEFQLVVEPPGGGLGRSIRTVNRIEAGQKLVYAPIVRQPKELDDARVTLALVPSDSKTDLVVLPPKPARTFAEWEVPTRTAVVAFVFGPQGLDTKRVTSLVRRDRQLVEQLADYAEQTARTETLITALARWDSTPSATDSLNAALAGFSSATAVKLDRTSSTDQQVSTLLRTLNPALARIDPLAPEPRQKMQQSALLASSVAGLFFGSPVGLAAGGAAMFVNLSNMMFPDTEFRSAFVQPASAHSSMLCANRDRAKSRTRAAYLWAVRAPDADPPSLALAGPAHALIGASTPVRLSVSSRDGWKFLDRAADWTLTPADAEDSIAINVKARPEAESIEIDLKETAAQPGAYRLAARWDWERVGVAGEIHLHQIDDAQKPYVAAAARDTLVAGTGKAPLVVRGMDFQFLEKLELRRQGETAGSPLEFKLSEGPRAGPQFETQTSIETGAAAPGPYSLVFQFLGGRTRELPIRVLPPHPTLDRLPLRVNSGDGAREVVLNGTGLDRVEGIQASRGVVQLDPCGKPDRRTATVALGPDAKKGDRVDLLLKVEGVQAPVHVPNAIEVIGPLPRIMSAQVSLPGELGMELLDGELPAGSFASFALRVHPLESPPAVRVGCVEPTLTLRAETARLGEERGGLRLQSAGGGALFLSLDPGAIGQPGCAVTVVVFTESQGASDPFELGKVVRLPRIDSFELTDQKQGELGYAATLKGEDLEVIERVGWDAQFGLPVTDLPVPVASGGRKQSLKVTIPWPSPVPHAPVYVWLRGESKGRATSARY
ncbi:MAG: hypothetical protein KIT09_31580 [Bryobacteraceae bacterium]|nr:hypothetical protein [Bryobacteraceae bacterium]